MYRCKTTLLAALFASAGLASSAWAQDQTKDKTKANKADATQVVPDREDLKPGAAPTVRRMDDNAQRQHDRDRDGGATSAGGAATGSDSAQRGGTTAGSGATGSGATSGASTGDGAQVAQGVRDWNQIDKNNDNLIQPEEMEEWLKQVGPQAKQ